MMAANSKVFMKMERRRESDCILGWMEITIWGTGGIIRLTSLACILGMTEDCIVEIGVII